MIDTTSQEYRDGFDAGYNDVLHDGVTMFSEGTNKLYVAGYFAGRGEAHSSHIMKLKQEYRDNHCQSCGKKYD